MNVNKTADRVVDLGPEGGHRGGMIIAEGTPEELAAMPQSYTGQFLVKTLGMDKTMVGTKANAAKATKKKATKKTARRTIGRAHVELQSLMRSSYAVFSQKKQTITQ